MANFQFSFDQDGFKRAMEAQVNEGCGRWRRAQHELDAVFDQHQGEVAADIVPQVEAALRRVAWNFHEDQIQAYAQVMAEVGASSSSWRAFVSSAGPKVR